MGWLLCEWTQSGCFNLRCKNYVVYTLYEHGMCPFTRCIQVCVCVSVWENDHFKFKNGGEDRVVSQETESLVRILRWYYGREFSDLIFIMSVGVCQQSNFYTKPVSLNFAYWYFCTC